MSVFHRIEDIYEMESAKFFRFAERLGCYQGALMVAIENERAKTVKHAKAPTATPVTMVDAEQLNATLKSQYRETDDAMPPVFG